jgi:prepilin-type N-terminal cleavage/methylation domain-containing protein
MKNKAFTLIELLVVIAIVGLLSTIVLVSTSDLSYQASLAKTLAWSRSINSALGPDAVGIWNFDEGIIGTCSENKDACDISGWNNHGTFSGDITYVTDTPSSQGHALDFDGDGDSINCGNNSSLDLTEAFTLEAWITGMSGNQGYEGIIAKYQYAGGGIFTGFFMTNHWSYFTAGIGNGTLTNNCSLQGFNLNDGKWHHLVFTYDSAVDKIVLYHNENLKNECDTSIEPGSTSESLRIGYWYPGDHQFYNGKIDNVRVYSTALTASQVQSHYYIGLDRLLAKGLISQKEYNQRLALK